MAWQAGKLPINHQIVYQLPDIFNLLPNINTDELMKSFAIKTNDNFLAIYLASIIRAIVALHDLINNKLVNKEKERVADDADKGGSEKDKKEKEEEKNEGEKEGSNVNKENAEAKGKEEGKGS